MVRTGKQGTVPRSRAIAALVAALALAAGCGGGSGASDPGADPGRDVPVKQDPGTDPGTDLPGPADPGAEATVDTPPLTGSPDDLPDPGNGDLAPGDEGIAWDGFTVVDLDPGAPPALQLAVQACAGLHNREDRGSVYVRMEAQDQLWLDHLDLQPKAVVGAQDFLDACVARFPACVRYSYEAQQVLLPAILTVAAALGAVPLDMALTAACGDLVFDAIQAFADRDTPYLATKYVFENYGQQTTGLAMLNPGYDQHASDPSNPALTGDMASALVDFVFSQRLFVVFLVHGCIDGHPEKDLLHAIVNAGRWPTPLGVYGYNNSWMVFGGYYYEAQTRCLDSRNMGAIPTETGNLSFFSTRRAPIRDAKELDRTDPEAIAYDPSMTYVAFVIGDGDNVRFLMTSRNEWLRQRLEDCGKADTACEPVTWSISPHLARIAPDVLAWYYRSSRRTGRDWFILPPSGHLYAYPSSLAEADQGRFVAATEQDARILGVNSTVHWDWADTWAEAEDRFLPRYARADGVIRGVYPVNVPYMLPAFPWWPEDRFFRVLEGADGGRVVVFRPREWRGIHDDADPFFFSPQKMAEELAAYPRGTVTGIYMTSDGGLTLRNSFMELVRILPSHVRLVSADTAARLALAAAGHP